MTEDNEPCPKFFNEDESWADEGHRISSKFERIVKNFIDKHPEYKLRDLEYLLTNSLGMAFLGALVDKRFKWKK